MSATPILGWGRPIAGVFETYHAIVELNPKGSAVTACRGRWPFSEPHVFYPLNSDTNVRLGECCLACIREVGGESMAAIVWALTADDDEKVVIDIEGP